MSKILKKAAENAVYILCCFFVVDNFAQVPSVDIGSFFNKNNVEIESASNLVMVDKRMDMVREVEKLLVVIPTGRTRITCKPEHVKDDLGSGKPDSVVLDFVINKIKSTIFHFTSVKKVIVTNPKMTHCSSFSPNNSNYYQIPEQSLKDSAFNHYDAVLVIKDLCISETGDRGVRPTGFSVQHTGMAGSSPSVGINFAMNSDSRLHISSNILLWNAKTKSTIMHGMVKVALPYTMIDRSLWIKIVVGFVHDIFKKTPFALFESPRPIPLDEYLDLNLPPVTKCGEIYVVDINLIDRMPFNLEVEEESEMNTIIFDEIERQITDTVKRIDYRDLSKYRNCNSFFIVPHVSTYRMEPDDDETIGFMRVLFSIYKGINNPSVEEFTLEATGKSGSGENEPLENALKAISAQLRKKTINSIKHLAASKK